MPASSALKVWVEGGQIEDKHFPGYATNPVNSEKQSIVIDTIDVHELMRRPTEMWNYDILIYGLWDGFGARGYNDPMCNFPDEVLTAETIKYIDAGYSVVAGHDTIGRISGTAHGLGRIRDRFKVKVGGRNDETEVDVDAQGVPMTKSWEIWGITAEVVKDTHLTDYPWTISGKTFETGQTHTFCNFALGNIWMKIIENREINRCWEFPYDNIS